MKVLILNQAFWPDSVATSQYATDIATFLAKRGHEVTALAGCRDYTDRMKRYPKVDRLEDIRIVRVASTGFGKQGLAGRLLDTVSYELMHAYTLTSLPRPDLVLAFTSPPLVGLQGALAARHWGVPFVHWLMNVNHEMAVALGHLAPNAKSARLLRKLHAFTLGESALVVVMDRWMRERTLQQAKIPPERVAVVPLWPAHQTEDAGSASQDASKLRQQLGLAHAFVIAHSGNLSHIHPLDTVLAASVALKHDPGVAFAFIGEGTRARDVVEVVRRENLSNVHQLPHQPREKLGASLGLANLQLIIMGNEAVGLAHSSKIYSILEAGVPFLFVGPRDSHLGELTAECRHGYHVEHGDVQGFLRVVDEVRALSVAELEAWREQSRVLARGRFGRTQLLADFAQRLELLGSG